MANVRLRRVSNACSNDVWHVVEGGALIATVLPWPTSKGKRYVLVDHDNKPRGRFKTPMLAKDHAKLLHKAGGLPDPT
jgi:hypothetical protein